MFLVYSLPTFAEGCSLSDTSSSPVQSYKQNIDTLNTFIRKQADASSCDKGTTGTSKMWNYIATIVPMEGAVSLMKEVSSLASSGWEFYTESAAFLDPAGPLNELSAHRDTIEEIERSILETTQYVWAHCAWWLKITEDAFQGKVGYDTRDRTLSQVLIEMARETSEVKRFFSILWQWIQTEEYIDEVPFPIASSGFSDGMYVYFSPKKLQECRDKNPRKQAFMEVIKKAFTIGWKYPQAIQVWKDAMALLLYRWSQIGGGASDPAKDAQINRIVQAKKGWLGNSDIMINSQFFKEFWYRPDSRTTKESIQNLEKKSFYEKTGYDFVRKVIPSLVAREGWQGGLGYVKNIWTTEELEKIRRLQSQDDDRYKTYNTRKTWIVEKAKASDPKLTSDFAQLVQDTKKHYTSDEEAYKSVCRSLGKQATNIGGAWRCTS